MFILVKENVLMVLVSIKDNNSAYINMEIILLLVLRKNLQYRHILMVLK